MMCLFPLLVISLFPSPSPPSPVCVCVYICKKKLFSYWGLKHLIYVSHYAKHQNLKTVNKVSK